MEPLNESPLDDKLQADNPELDKEHSVQINLLETLETAIAAKAATEKIGAVLGSLADFTEAHFNSEQILMRLHAYPDFEAHDMDHNAFMETIRHLQMLHDGGDHLDPGEVARLRKRITGHIATKDKAFGTFMVKHASF